MGFNLTVNFTYPEDASGWYHKSYQNEKCNQAIEIKKKGLTRQSA